MYVTERTSLRTRRFDPGAGSSSSTTSVTWSRLTNLSHLAVPAGVVSETTGTHGALSATARARSIDSLSVVETCVTDPCRMSVASTWYGSSTVNQRTRASCTFENATLRAAPFFRSQIISKPFVWRALRAVFLRVRRARVAEEHEGDDVRAGGVLVPELHGPSLLRGDLVVAEPEPVVVL